MQAQIRSDPSFEKNSGSGPFFNPDLDYDIFKD